MSTDIAPTATSPTPGIPATAGGLMARLGDLSAWMCRQGLLPAGRDLAARRMPGGQSNPSWRLESGSHHWVLRAKPAPAAQLLPSAHAIEREYRVLHALQGTPVPVPRVRALCEDESVIGVAFYLMDFVPGRVFADPSLPDVPTEARAAYYDAAARTLAALHQMDWRARGLLDFGRHSGYFSRLVRRWSQQYVASREQPVPAMERLMAWLPENIPAEADGEAVTCITHGDFRMENLMFHPERPEVVAVLDWELSTLGHPLSDLAYNALAWHMPAGILRGLADLNLPALGLPSEASYVAAYCRHAGLDPTALGRDWPFHLAFNLFRLAAILQGIGQRERAGTASNASAREIAALAPTVAGWGWAIAQGHQPDFRT
jgi:aminoglycoside phosphotransferase (APT) family kinase protein